MSWTNHKGQSRTGIVSRDVFTLEAVKREAQVSGAKWTRTKAVVVPADGGPTLPLCLPNSNNPEALVKDDGRWRRVVPANNQLTIEMETAA